MAQRDLTDELRHRRQHRKATTTILVVILMLFFAFWYAFSYYRASSEPEAPAAGSEPSCRPYDPAVATPGTTTVNVYNATTRPGLAARTASQLRSRGYRIGEVANDPLDRTVAGPAEVRFGPAGASRAQLLIPLGGKGTTQLADKRTSAVVDLVVGAKFTALAAAPSPTGPPMCPAPSPTGATASPTG